jgi:hypothetical protein
MKDKHGREMNNHKRRGSRRKQRHIELAEYGAVAAVIRRRDADKAALDARLLNNIRISEGRLSPYSRRDPRRRALRREANHPGVLV